MNSPEHPFVALLRPLSPGELSWTSPSSFLAYGIGLLLLVIFVRSNGNVSYVIGAGDDALRCWMQQEA